MNRIFVCGFVALAWLCLPAAAMAESCYVRTQWEFPAHPSYVAHILFRNPSNSGMRVAVKELHVICTDCAVGFRDLATVQDQSSAAIGNSSVGTVPNGLHVDRIGELSGIFSKTEIYNGSSGDFNTALPMGQIATVRVQRAITSPLVLQSNRAILIRANTLGQQLVVSAHWCESPE